MTPTDSSPPPDAEPRLVHLTESQLDDIAERAVKKVFEKIYAEVGKGVLKKLAWAIGLVTTAALLWLAGKGALPK